MSEDLKKKLSTLPEDTIKVLDLGCGYREVIDYVWLPEKQNFIYEMQELFREKANFFVLGVEKKPISPPYNFKFEHINTEYLIYNKDIYLFWLDIIKDGHYKHKFDAGVMNFPFPDLVKNTVDYIARYVAESIAQILYECIKPGGFLVINSEIHRTEWKILQLKAWEKLMREFEETNRLQVYNKNFRYSFSAIFKRKNTERKE